MGRKLLKDLTEEEKLERVARRKEQLKKAKLTYNAKLTAEQLNKKREKDRVENQTVEQVETKRENNRNENLTVEQLEKKRENNRNENLTEGQIVKKRKRAAESTTRTRAKKQKLLLGAMYESGQKVEYKDTGDMTVECGHCGALSFDAERSSKNSCCHGGKISLPPLDNYPEELVNLRNANGEIGRHFRENIRVYNNLFAFASFNAQNCDMKGGGPYAMRIVGEAHLKATTSLKAAANRQAQFGQIYIYDSGEALHQRSKEVKREDVLTIIQPILNKNPYADKFRTLHDIQEKNQDQKYSLCFYTRAEDHARVYNKPTCDELAAIISSKDGAIDRKIDVRVK
ncbi:uncharacterized protein [Bactrocera oleae]|uniref:uncharacterized protein n=1 Tax=Bactrocera oleae TaxID=104688 RepID=UPI00387E5094